MKWNFYTVHYQFLWTVIFEALYFFRVIIATNHHCIQSIHIRVNSQCSCITISWAWYTQIHLPPNLRINKGSHSQTQTQISCCTWSNSTLPQKFREKIKMGSKIGLKINIFFGAFGVLGGVIGFIVLHAFENYLAGKSFIILDI